MKFNDYELITVSVRNSGRLEGRLAHQKPEGKDWMTRSQSNPFKEYWFKLIGNLLFYYPISESIDYSQPRGVFVLEGANVSYENSRKVPFAFSINFADEDKRKHVFGCRSDLDVSRWVEALQSSSYEYWRSQLKIIEKKLEMRKGDVTRTQFGIAKQLNWHKEEQNQFTCHLQDIQNCKHNCTNTSNQTNLIDL